MMDSMNEVEKKIEEILSNYVLGTEDEDVGETDRCVKELTSLIQEERQGAVKEFAKWVGMENSSGYIDSFEQWLSLEDKDKEGRV